MKKILIIAVLIVAVVAVVWHRSTRADTANLALAQNAVGFCPSVSDVKKNPVKGNWISTTKYGKFKSFHMDFSTNLTKFVGAQWVGENLGQITCVYKSEQRFNMDGQPVVQATLPVLLVFHTLAFAPSGALWQHIKRGVRNCNSITRHDCPFKVNMQPTTGNILQQAESVKKNAANQGPNY